MQSSVSCETNQHERCNLTECDCGCHLFRPRVGFNVWRFIFVAALLWVLIIMIGLFIASIP